jgi:Zn-dependent peptidase ImmA (M78 family)/DNA-binding XRE family transcriptional regulator
MEIGKRIRSERKRLGLTLEDLSAKVGFPSYQTLASIEKGKKKIKVSELDKIAKALGLTVSFLIGEEERGEEKVVWRKCTDEAKCKRYENKLIALCKNYKKLAELVGYKYKRFVPPGIEELQKDNYENDFIFASELAEEWGKRLELGRYPGNNLLDALKQENILVFCEDLGGFGSAASLVGDFGAAILLNKNDMPWRRTFDIAHELFHLLTWDIYPPEEIYDDEERGRSNPEKYANAFAASLLLPEKSLRDEIENCSNIEALTLVDIIEIAVKFKVSIQYLTWRLENLLTFSKLWEEMREKVFNGLDFEEIRKHPQIQQLNKLRRNEEPSIPKLPEIYVNQALKAYIKGRISKLKLADYLNIRYVEMSSFLHEYSYPDIEELSLEGIST